MLFLLVFLLPVGAREEVTIEHYSVESGLSQNTVMAIMQDRKGFMWFGTWDGLNKFDGYEFTIYKSRPGDMSNIATNRIDLIHEDKLGFIWIQTYDGKFHRFNPKTEQFFSLKQSTNRFSYNVERSKRFFESSTGEIWIATDDFGAVRAITDPLTDEISIIEYSTFSEQKLISNRINFILEDKEKNIWLGTDKGLQSINTRTNQLRTLQPNEQITSNAFHSGLETETKLIFGDDNGNAWLFDKAENKFDRLQLKNASTVTDIKAINSENILFSTLQGGFFVYNLRKKQLRNFSKSNHPQIRTNRFQSVMVDSYQIAWLESDLDGVFRYRLSDNSVRHFQPVTDAVSRVSVLPNFFIVEDINKKLWINPQGGGFSLYNREKDELEYFYNNPFDPKHSLSNVIHSAYADRFGNLWMCTYNKGLEKLSFYTPKFDLIPVNPALNTITSNEIRATYQLTNGNIIMASKDGSIRFFNKDLKELGLLNSSGKLAPYSDLSDLGYCIMEDSRKRIWIGTKGMGVIQLTASNNDPLKPEYDFQRYQYNRLDNNSLSNDNIYSIIEDNEGRILIGTFGGGLNVADDSNGQMRFISYRNKLSSYPIQNCSKIRHLLLDKENTLWVATTNGLLQINDFMTPKMKEHYIQKIPNDKNSLSNNDVHYLHQTKDGELWIGTFGGGLISLRKKAREKQLAEFNIFTTREGLYNDIVLSIQEDQKGNLWFSSENSISRYDRKNKMFQNYEIFHGLNDAHFSEAASLQTNKGEMIFGSNKGFCYFYPEDIQQNIKAPPIVFTRFQLFNQDVRIDEKNSPLKLSIGYSSELTMNHKQTVFSIEYAALDFSDVENIKYAFMLENFENEWNYVQKQRKATYTNLPKGTYYFKVKSTNAEGVWTENEKSIKIHILPSFWETGTAYLIYILFFLSILYAVYYITKRFAQLKHDVDVEHKVSDIKLRFFTNISHELRTPLTLITGPIENILKYEAVNENVKDQLSVVQRNANRMLRMINQILDFRKIQHKKLRLQIQAIRIDKLVAEICSNFSKEAQDKNIRFNFDDKAPQSILWVDRDKVDMIIYNLLSNAFKFTPEGKSIEVKLLRKDDSIQIQVIDEGVGIPKEKRSFLFERFTSANEIKSISGNRGSGIGLNLVKELVDLHKGSIEVESEPGAGTNFTVSFLKGKEHFGNDVDFIIAEDIKSGITEEYEAELLNRLEDLSDCRDESSSVRKELPLVLVVEDNEEMRSFLEKILSKFFRVITAVDGLEGLKMALELIPDIVVTDLMMPQLDGLELTERLKKHQDTSHIPVVLLTAKSAVESRLEAMKQGADDYITKPFSPVLLEARIENILAQRKRLQDAYRHKLMGLDPKPVDLPSQDDLFIAKLLEYMDKNIENCDLTVDQMVSDMAMGRTVFFNKLKNLTGLAPIEFIRELRIKRAAQLLKTGDFNVSQVTYMVGMSDSRYFSKCFKKVYGMTPSEYKKSFES